jgi:hypothetical protein
MSARGRSILTGLAALGAAAGIAAWWLSSSRERSFSQDAPVAPPSPSAQVASSTLPSPSSRAGAQPAESRVARAEREWESFRDRFGAHLTRELSVDGDLLAVRGAPGQGERAAGAFRPDNAALALARANEVVAGASELLGLDASFPLGDPVAQTGSATAQVYFRETWQGIPLEPLGSVVVDLGPQGELLNLSTDYVRDVRVTGRSKLSADEAKARVEEAVTPSLGSALPASGARSVIWVARGSAGGPATGRRAYSFGAGGRQVVVDAENGKILFNRDRRQH